MTNRRRVRGGLWRGKAGSRLLPQRLRHLGLGAVAAACGLTLAGLLALDAPRLWQAIKTHPYFALTGVEVTGTRRLSRAQILEWAGVREGASIWDAAPGAVRSRLESHAWVLRAGVRREFPHRLIIAVSERRPVAIVRLDGFEYVDRSGHILGPLRAGDSRDFPVITGLDTPAAADFVAVGIHRALQFLRLCTQVRAVDEVSEVHVDRARGVTVFPRRTRVAVALGWGNWRDKLARTARVLAAWSGQVERVARVDATFKDMVVVRLREEPPAPRRVAKRGLRV